MSAENLREVLLKVLRLLDNAEELSKNVELDEKAIEEIMDLINTIIKKMDNIADNVIGLSEMDEGLG